MGLQNKPLFAEHRDRITVGDMNMAKRTLREVIVALWKDIVVRKCFLLRQCLRLRELFRRIAMKLGPNLKN